MCDSGTDDKKFPVYKVTRKDYPGNSCVYRDWATLYDGELDSAEIGDMIEVTLLEMTEKEFEDLGVFEGW